jgi:hypothetical protein
MIFRTAILLLLLAGVVPPHVQAQSEVTFSATTVADAFVATGSPTNTIGPDLANDNFGHAGILYITPAASPNGEYESLLQFDLSGATNLFTTSYGPSWLVTNVSLTFAGNFGGVGEQPDNSAFNPISGGNFVIEWLADNNWLEGTGRPNQPTTDGVTYASLPALLAQPAENLCTNTYVPPGDNVAVTWALPLSTNLVNNIANGTLVTFRLYAADNKVSYLFNSHNFAGNHPLINITAIPLLKITSGRWTNGVFRLAGLGIPNQIYQIQASTNLTNTNWLTLGGTNADTAGTIQFDDPSPIQTIRFYRLVH